MFQEQYALVSCYSIKGCNSAVENSALYLCYGSVAKYHFRKKTQVLGSEIINIEGMELF